MNRDDLIWKYYTLPMLRELEPKTKWVLKAVDKWNRDLYYLGICYYTPEFRKRAYVTSRVSEANKYSSYAAAKKEADTLGCNNFEFKAVEVK